MFSFLTGVVVPWVGDGYTDVHIYQTNQMVHIEKGYFLKFRPVVY